MGRKAQQVVRVPFGNDPAKIEKYLAFWNREDTKRPLVGFSYNHWYPLEEYSATAKWKQMKVLTPDMVSPEEFLDDEEEILRQGEIFDDDLIRGACPLQGIPWIDAMLVDCLYILPGNVRGSEQCKSWEELETIRLDHENPWFKRYTEFAQALVTRSRGRFPVSHAPMSGPSDQYGLLRGGQVQSIFDLVDEPEKAAKVLRKLGAIFADLHRSAWKHIPPFHGGCFDAFYQLWSPGPIIRWQEDNTALFSPELYRKFLKPVDTELAACCPYSLLHLHSSSMPLLDDFLEIEQIKCFEINIDVGGPPIAQMIPYFQKVQKADRSLLIRGILNENEVREMMDALSPAGLYVYLMVSSVEEAEKLRPLLGM